MKRIQRIWLNKLAHFSFLLILALVLVISYGLSHRLLKSNYQASITELSDAAFKTYSYRRSADGQKVVVMQSGEILDSGRATLGKAPFGLERLESYRGVINDHLGKAAQ